MSRPNWRVHDILTVGLLIGIVSSVLWRAHTESSFGIEVRGPQDVTIRDFAAHFAFAKAVWSDGADYSVESHLAVTSEWAGRPVERSLPFGYSPTMLWLLAPLTPLPVVWGFTAWTLLSACAVWWMTRRRLAWWLASTFLLLSPLGALSFSLGQTAYLSAAGILLLMVSASRPPSTHRLATDAAPALALWALTAKPPLAIVGGAVLLASRRSRPVVLAVALTVATTLLITPRLGWTWPFQYLNLMLHYEQSTADPAFGWSLHPETMANLRALLWRTGFVGDRVASAVSFALWLLVTAGAWWLGRSRRISMRLAWVLIVVAYLTLSPHVSSTENLHLSLLLAAVGGAAWFAGDASPRVADRTRLAARALPFVAYVAVFSLPSGPVLSSSTYAYVVLTAVICTGLLAYRALSTSVRAPGS